MLALCFMAQGALAQGAPKSPNLFWATPNTGTGYLGLRGITTYDLGATPWTFGSASGMKCDGSTDDTVALQAAVNLVLVVHSPLMLPSGTCVISSTINIIPSSSSSLNFIGQGRGVGNAIGTLFQWNGNATTPMFKIRNVQRSLFQGFVIRSNDSAPLKVGIQSESAAGGNVTSGNTYRDILMNGTTASLDKGFAFVIGPGGIDQNNDTSVFDHDEVDNFTTAGWSFEHQESKAHYFYGCNIAGSPSGPSLYGVTTALGPSQQGGSFSWIGGEGSFLGVAFHMGNSNDPITILDDNIESSGRLMDQDVLASSSSAWPFTIEGTRFTSDALNADGKVINFWSGGPLVLIGNSIGTIPTTDLKIIQPGNPSYGISIGNYYVSSDAQVLQVQAGSPGYWTSIQDFQNNAGVRKLIKNIYGIGTYTVSGLMPLIPVAGMEAIITDQTTQCPASGGAFTGGGSVSCLAWYTGSVWATLTPSGVGAAVTIANLPACTVNSVGTQAAVSNGQTAPAFNGTVSTTGAVYAPVGCTQTAASTYGWVYK